MKTRKHLRALRAYPVDRAGARAVRRYLRAFGGNVTEAAAAMGITRCTLYRRIWALGLEEFVRGLR